MTRTLDVYLHQHLAGQLIQDEHGQMFFGYAESWLKNPLAQALSYSLPLRKERFRRNECRGFFAGILPEENQRQIIARNLGISSQNDFSLLEQIGGECAGAVTFIKTGEPLAARDYLYRTLNSSDLAGILRMLPRRPLLAGEEGVRLSLAGAQDKIAVRLAHDKISLPLGGAPSTHILKPAIAQFEGLVFNEALCMKLAHAVGLPTAKVEIGQVEGIDYLLVERYDRAFTGKEQDGIARLARLHQEDFCQALGIVPENKYQNEGGPSLQQCFELVRNISSAPVADLKSLFDATIFNFLIGNHDAHGKNFSFLYREQGTEGGGVRLAPFYDMLCTSYYPELSRKMAMKIGGEYDSGKITPKHFESLSEEIDFAAAMTKRRVTEMAEILLLKVAEVTPETPGARAVGELIRNRCKQVQRDYKR